MSALVRYTLARLGLFVASFGLVWAVGSPWLVWDESSVLWTVLLALVVSAAASLALLGRLRDELAEHVQRRAHRAVTAMDRSRRSEDD